MKTYHPVRRVPALSFCLLALCACGRHDVPAIEPPPRPAALPAAPDNLGRLRERAEQAMRDNRLYAPAGDNAIEYFLAARERQPDDARVHAALIELQPYLLIATEQVLERGESDQAQRLLQLMAKVDAQAPALPRLQAILEQMQRSRIAEQASLAADTRAGSMSAVAAAASPASAVDATQASALAAQSVALPAPVPEAEAAPPAAPASAAPPQAQETAATRTVPAAAVKVAALPRLLQDAQPRYPLPALRGGVEGSVEVAFDIQPDGSVRNARTLSATPEGVFDAAALAVAARWRFEPSGQSHRSQRTVRFRLPD